MWLVGFLVRWGRGQGIDRYLSQSVGRVSHRVYNATHLEGLAGGRLLDEEAADEGAVGGDTRAGGHLCFVV